MLGKSIADPDHVEEGGQMRGMELLLTETILQKSKKRCQIEGVVDELDGIFKEISGCRFSGYEIHMGETFDGRTAIAQNVIMSKTNKNVYGSYIHGIFDQAKIANAILDALAKKKGVVLQDGALLDYEAYKEKQYDKLADTLREYLNMEEIYGMLLWRPCRPESKIL